MWTARIYIPRTTRRYIAYRRYAPLIRAKIHNAYSRKTHLLQLEDVPFTVIVDIFNNLFRIAKINLIILVFMIKSIS